MCLFSLSLLWSSLVNPQTRSSLAVLPGLSAVVSTGALQLDCAMGVLKCSLTLNYLSRTSVLKESSMMRAKGNCSWVENVCYPTLEIHIDLLLVKYFFFPRGGLCSEGKVLVDVGYFLSPLVDFSFTTGEDFAGTRAGTLQHCAQ